ncbi:MAG: CsbD family protein [Methylocystis sp.]
MNWDFVQGNWKQVSGKVKQQWGKLTDDDLAKIAGKREELEGKLQERYGLSKDEIKKQLDDFMTRH